jgi:dihydroflavonol-4-reductase
MHLVTGATGIIGTHVLLHLMLKGENVIAAKQKSSSDVNLKKVFRYYTGNDTLYEKIIWREIDVRDIFSIEEALEGVTNVFHCAGLVSFNKKDRKRLFDLNEKGTRNVVDACLVKKIEALCHVSTIGTINNLDYRLPLDETVFWKKSGRESDYALSKYNAEREVWRGMEEGLNAVIVNPGVVLAPGFWDQSSSRIFKNCYKGSLFYTTGTTGYVAATDVAQIMVELVEKKQFGNRYILIEGNYTFREIFNVIHRNFNKPVPRLRASGTLLRLGKFIESVLTKFTGKEPLLSPALINAALNEQLFSNELIKKALNYKFQPIVPLLGDICKHYVSEHKKTGSTL